MAAKNWIGIASLLVSVLVPHVSAAQVNISSCQVINTPGSYILTSDLTASGDCLVVTASDVLIDLGGFTITGPGSANGIVDDGTSADGLQTGIRIRNGTVQQFANGINLDFSLQTAAQRVRVNANTGYGLSANAQAFVENSVFTNNANGLILGAGSVVTGNSASGNVTGNGIGVAGCSYVAGNTAKNNGNGIVIGEGSTALNNVARSNVVGMSVFCDPAPTFCGINGATNLFRNTLRGNTDQDLIMFSATPATCRMIDNTVG